MKSVLQGSSFRERLILFLIVGFVLFKVNTANSQLLYADDFNSGYLSFVSISGQQSWTKGGSGPELTTQTASPLTYSGYEGANASVYLQMPAASGTTSRLYRSFTTTTAGTNTFFVSFLLNITSASASPEYFLSLGDPGTNSGYFSRVFVRSSGAGFQIGLSKTSSTGTYGSTVYNFNQTYYVVVRYSFVSGGTNDLNYIWVNPSLTTEPTAGTADVSISTGTDAGLNGGNVGNFHWHNRTSSNPVGRFDGVRVSVGSSSAASWANLAVSKATNNVNGTVANAEYGSHFNGMNQQTTGAGPTWYMYYDATNLYIGTNNSGNIGEAMVLYFDKDPITPINGGTNSNGNLTGFNYDGSSFANLQFRADLVMYIRDSYREYRTADGAGGWSGPTSSFGTFSTGTQTMEIAIPWSVFGGQPAVFNWFGYRAYSGGGAYASIPTENPGSGSGLIIGTGARWERYYTVNTTGITLPFARNCYVFNQTSDQVGFGAITVQDFTMNSSGRSITRGSGAWNIVGNLRVDAGTINFGSVTQSATIGGNLFNSGTLTLSTNIGGDIITQGNITDNGTFNANNRAIFFQGDNIQTIQGSGTFDISYVRINKTAGRVVLGSNLDCPGPGTGNAMELNSATSILDLNGFTLTLGQAGVNSTYSGTGFIRSSPTSSINILGTGALGTMLFDQTTDGTTNSIRNFTLNRTSSGTATLGNKLIITGGLSAANEGTLTVTNGTLNTGGFLVIGSNANGTARIAPNTSGGTYINGDVQVERFIPANANRAWRLLGVPLATSATQTVRNAWMEGAANPNAFDNNVSGYGTILIGNYVNTAAAQADGYDDDGPSFSIRRFEPSTFTLQGIGNINTKQLASENGYFVYLRGDRSVLPANNTASPTATTLRSKGTVQQGSKTYTIGAAQRALIGNPFASAIDLNTISYTGSVTGANVSVWDPKLGTVGGYVTLTRSGSIYQVTIGGGGSYPANGTTFNNLQSGQAFFTNEDGAGTVTIPETAKTTGSTQVFRPNGTTSVQPRMFVTFSNPISTGDRTLDGVYVNFDGNFSNEVDNYDGLKNNNFADNLAMLKAGKRLAVEQRGAVVTSDTVFFQMGQVRQTTYKLNFKLVDMDPTLFARLEDKFTGTNTTINMNAETDYTFTVTADAASSAADRFRLVFMPLGSGPLPVSFIHVKAQQQAANISVGWETGTELNVLKYEVEKSANGREFATIGTQSATGNGVYNWLDVNVAVGTQWYRIKAIDRNGSFKYSAIVRISTGRGVADISAWPNPVKGSVINLQFSNEAAGRYHIRLTNVTGQTLLSRNIQHAGGSASQPISLSSQAIAGVYQLEIISPNGNKRTQKLIIE